MIDIFVSVGDPQKKLSKQNATLKMKTLCRSPKSTKISEGGSRRSKKKDFVPLLALCTHTRTILYKIKKQKDKKGTCLANRELF